jgi:hypothetical protein
MRRNQTEAYRWAEQEFGCATLGDRRRRDRLVLMAAAASEHPDGRVCEVFSNAGEMHGAYDFLETRHATSAELTAAMGRATAKRCMGLPFVYVAVDGSSLTLTDTEHEKGFGSIGAGAYGARGLKVISALAMDARGTTMGLLSQTWWSRPKKKKKTVEQRRRLRTEDKETQRWIDTIQQATARCAEHQIKPWFVLDREADGRAILLALRDSGHTFTVRSSWDRAVESTGHDRQYLRATLETQRALGRYVLQVPAGPNRSKRAAQMVLRAMPLTIRLPDRRTRQADWLPLTAVWVREEGTVPAGERPIDWMLYTNHPVKDLAGARNIVAGYAKRWRIEEFHRTWKSGACNVERTQLRSVEAAKKWATILAAVATRIERLKFLSRNDPDKSATVELSEDEVRVLVALARNITKRAERAPTVSLTIGDAISWIARLGGYTGKSSGGPPGSITIRRGLERLRFAIAGARAMGTLEK